MSSVSAESGAASLTPLAHALAPLLHPLAALLHPLLELRLLLVVQRRLDLVPRGLGVLGHLLPERLHLFRHLPALLGLLLLERLELRDLVAGEFEVLAHGEDPGRRVGRAAHRHRAAGGCRRGAAPRGILCFLGLEAARDGEGRQAGGEEERADTSHGSSACRGSRGPRWPPRTLVQASRRIRLVRRRAGPSCTAPAPCPAASAGTSCRGGNGRR